jgi:serine/threonine protein kinase
LTVAQRTEASSLWSLDEQPVTFRAGPGAGDILNGTYRIVRPIGYGGMADVYEVEHVRLNARYAIKMLRAQGGREDAASKRRFLREARLLAGLRSDHIVTVFDVSAADATPPFYAMELLNGCDLRRLLGSVGELSVPRATKIVVDACLGIAHAHAAGLVHRDLKPENLFVLSRDTGEETCKLLDFGVVKAEFATSTEHDGLIGTLKYMSPEQLTNGSQVTPLSDVRALGAILYECLAGRAPYGGDSPQALIFNILNTEARAIRDHRPNVPCELETVVLRALARDPAERFQSAEALADALRNFTRDSMPDFVNVTASSTTPVAPVGARQRLPLRNTITILTTIAGIAIGYGINSSGITTARSAARAEGSSSASSVVTPATRARDAALPLNVEQHTASVTSSRIPALAAPDTSVLTGTALRVNGVRVKSVSTKAALPVPHALTSAEPNEAKTRAPSSLAGLDLKNPYASEEETRSEPHRAP